MVQRYPEAVLHLDSPVSDRSLVPEPPLPGAGRVLAVLTRRPPGSETAERFPILQPDVAIGRIPGNDVVLTDPSVSARHARLRLAGGVWTLADLGSINGSLVDGEPVQQALPLAPGSIIRLGEVELAFAPQDRWEDSSADVSVPMVPKSAARRPAVSERDRVAGYVLDVPKGRGIPIPVLIGLAVIALSVIGYILARGG